MSSKDEDEEMRHAMECARDAFYTEQGDWPKVITSNSSLSDVISDLWDVIETWCSIHNDWWLMTLFCEQSHRLHPDKPLTNSGDIWLCADTNVNREINE